MTKSQLFPQLGFWSLRQYCTYRYTVWIYEYIICFVFSNISIFLAIWKDLPIWHSISHREQIYMERGSMKRSTIEKRSKREVQMEMKRNEVKLSESWEEKRKASTAGQMREMGDCRWRGGGANKVFVTVQSQRDWKRRSGRAERRLSWYKALSYSSCFFVLILPFLLISFVYWLSSLHYFSLLFLLVSLQAHL